MYIYFNQVYNKESFLYKMILFVVVIYINLRYVWHNEEDSEILVLHTLNFSPLRSSGIDKFLSK